MRALDLFIASKLLGIKIRFKEVNHFQYYPSLLVSREYYFYYFPSSSDVKNLPAVQETQVQSPGWEDALKKGTANYSSIVAWKISWTEEPNGLQFIRSQRVGHN